MIETKILFDWVDIIVTIQSKHMTKKKEQKIMVMMKKKEYHRNILTIKKNKI